MIEKTCCDCLKSKPVKFAFYRDKRNGHYSIRCKDCSALRARLRQAQDESWRDKRREYIRNWVAENKEECQAYAKLYREDHKEKQAQYFKEWYKQNKDRILEKRRNDKSPDKEGFISRKFILPKIIVDTLKVLSKELNKPENVIVREALDELITLKPLRS